MEKDFIYLNLDALAKTLDGDVKHDRITRTIYSTDASAYKEEPLAVIWPKNPGDIKKIIAFAREEETSLTMRAAGTSLAGQVVGAGIIVDISRYMKRIIEVNKEEMWVIVEPGVVLDELNMHLKKYGLFFGPETSTSNRCNLGGMTGNNACGSHSIIYGSTRDHIIEMRTLLSDGSEAVFKAVTKEAFEEKCRLGNLEGSIYRQAREMLSDEINRKIIKEEFPDPSIPRRNTGYALDLLSDTEIFEKTSTRKFNFCNILAGSEGTLAVTTEIKLNLVKLPPPNKALVCVHLEKRNDAFLANLIALKYNPSAVEMMDDRILRLTEDNISQKRNRFFLEGNPESIVIVEFVNDDPGDLDKVIKEMVNDLKSAGYGYAYPVIRGKDITRVWDLRKAGLGVLTNMKGDSKPVSLIEDTAVNVRQMPEYIAEFEKMLAKYGKDVVYHAHIGTGELHIRPVLNLKDPADVDLFRTIGVETAKLVKKYRGSMSGEHGDGRLRGEFIPLIIGEHNYSLLKEVKKTWDPQNILNPGKITDTPRMNTHLRYQPGVITPDIKTFYDFSSSDGIIRAAERCNGSGDCRKTPIIGGTMCPTFMATDDEQLCTRARANIVREFLGADEKNHWNHREVYEVLDLCISCKGCKAECPSGVDIAKLKSEFLQHWYDKHGIPLRTLLIAYISLINRIGSVAPSVFNFFAGNKATSFLIKRMTGFAEKRSIPLLNKVTLRKWLRSNLASLNPANPKKTICLFVDEFTNFNDTSTGIAAVKLLTSLGYSVRTVNNNDSARTFISKGMIRKARKVIRKNLEMFADIVSGEIPLVGIEPSAILGFRDEYPELAGADMKDKASMIAANTWYIDEFIEREYDSGNIQAGLFADDPAEILLHAHCQQKAISSSACSLKVLTIPSNFKVREIPSGCCGMAGSFGYEKEHFELSNKIGEMILFPEIRNAGPNVIIAAPGTSCRHHIKDGTGKVAKHPVEILYEALKK